MAANFFAGTKRCCTRLVIAVLLVAGVSAFLIRSCKPVASGSASTFEASGTSERGTAGRHAGADRQRTVQGDRCAASQGRRDGAEPSRRSGAHPAPDRALSTGGGRPMAVDPCARPEHQLGPGKEINFNVRNQPDFLGTLSETSATLNMLLAGIAAVSLLVGGIGIMNIVWPRGLSALARLVCASRRVPSDSISSRSS